MDLVDVKGGADGPDRVRHGGGGRRRGDFAAAVGERRLAQSGGAHAHHTSLGSSPMRLPKAEEQTWAASLMRSPSPRMTWSTALPPAFEGHDLVSPRRCTAWRYGQRVREPGPSADPCLQGRGSAGGDGAAFLFGSRTPHPLARPGTWRPTNGRAGLLEQSLAKSLVKRSRDAWALAAVRACAARSGVKSGSGCERTISKSNYYMNTTYT